MASMEAESELNRVTLEGRNLIIPLDEFESRVVKKALPLLAPMLQLQIKISSRVLLHLLSTDKHTFRQQVARVEAGEDPASVMGDAFAQVRDSLMHDTELRKFLDTPSLAEIEELLPESDD